MKKSDLKSGMVVVINGDRYVLIGDNFVNDTGFMGLESYDEDLNYKYSSDSGEWDITKVYSAPNWGRGFTERLSTLYASELLWDRKREVVWERVPKGTKVQILVRKISSLECTEWVNRYFVGKSKSTGDCEVSSIKEDDDFTGVKMSDYALHGYVKEESIRIHPNVQIEKDWCKYER